MCPLALVPARLFVTFATVVCASVGVIAAPLPATTSMSGTGESFATKFDIGGGRKMFLECQGHGSPTVIFEAGYRNRGDVWSEQPDPKHKIKTVESTSTRLTRVCTYDRPGTTLDVDKTSRSDPVPMRRTAQDVVGDLHTLLGKAGLHGPFVLVAHSLGGLFVRLYASDYPEQVSGMVLVDPLTDQLQGLLGPDDWARYDALVAAAPKDLSSYSDLETINVDASFEQMRRAAATRPLRNMPLVVVARGRPVELPSTVPAGFSERLELAWRTSQQQVVALIPDGRLAVAQNASHYVQFDQPKAVVDAIRRVVSAVRRTHR